MHSRFAKVQVPAALPGLIVMLLVTGVALGLAAAEERLFGSAVIEALVLTLLIGIALRNGLPGARFASLKAGADVSAKQVLELGVALLGAGVFFPEILKAGPLLVGVIVGVVSCALMVSFLIGRALGLTTKLAVLVAVGNSICGNSAIAAVAPAIRADRKDVTSAIGLTAVIGVSLVLGLPLLVAPFGLGHYQYGVLAGMSAYAVPQVVAASFPVSQLSGEVATLVKLTRVLLLGPVVVVMSLLFRGNDADLTGANGAGSRRGATAYVPWFVVAFLALATLRSVGLLPEMLVTAVRETSRLLMVLAMAGLGFGVELAAVRKVGPRVGLAVVGSLAFMVTATLTLIRAGGLPL